jgi:hypothetical protein
MGTSDWIDNGGVRYILSSLIPALLADSTRKFVQVEQVQITPPSNGLPLWILTGSDLPLLYGCWMLLFWHRYFFNVGGQPSPTLFVLPSVSSLPRDSWNLSMVGGACMMRRPYTMSDPNADTDDESEHERMHRMGSLNNVPL